MRVGTNRTYLSRFFNQENGKTFYDYVNNYRVKYAEQLLSSTKDPLSFIAEKQDSIRLLLSAEYLLLYMVVRHRNTAVECQMVSFTIGTFLMVWALFVRNER